MTSINDVGEGLQPLKKLTILPIFVGKRNDTRKEEVARYVALSGEIIALTSGMDVERTTVVTLLLKQNYESVSSMLNAIRSTLTRNKVIRAAAPAILKGDDARMYDAVMDRAEDVERHRHRMAHYIWALADEMPDRLLLLKPERYAEQVAGKTSYRIIRGSALPWSRGFRSTKTPDLSKMDRRDSRAYSEADLVELVGWCERVTLDLRHLGMIVSRAPGYEQSRVVLGPLLGGSP